MCDAEIDEVSERIVVRNFSYLRARIYSNAQPPDNRRMFALDMRSVASVSNERNSLSDADATASLSSYSERAVLAAQQTAGQRDVGNAPSRASGRKRRVLVAGGSEQDAACRR